MQAIRRESRGRLDSDPRSLAEPETKVDETPTPEPSPSPPLAPREPSPSSLVDAVSLAEIPDGTTTMPTV